jgi:hypothetical protein
LTRRGKNCKILKVSPRFYPYPIRKFPPALLPGTSFVDYATPPFQKSVKNCISVIQNRGAPSMNKTNGDDKDGENGGDDKSNDPPKSFYFHKDDAPDSLTEVFGVRLKAERVDKELYNIIRSIQFVLFYSHSLKNSIDITEEEGATGFYYTISNSSNGLKTYVGRVKERYSSAAQNTPKITLMFLDQARVRWMKNEGFELTQENCARVGTIGIFQDLFSLVRFIAGKNEWKVLGYCRGEKV